jgi:DNA transformation protein
VGEKGAKHTQQGTDTANAVVADLAPLGDVIAKKMFGGFGIFCEEVMFGLIDSTGTVHLKADEHTEARFADNGAVKHGRMPYWTVPHSVLTSEEEFMAWAAEALEVARAAKR